MWPSLLLTRRNFRTSSGSSWPLFLRSRSRCIYERDNLGRSFDGLRRGNGGLVHRVLDREDLRFLQMVHFLNTLP